MAASRTGIARWRVSGLNAAKIRDGMPDRPLSCSEARPLSTWCGWSSSTGSRRSPSTCRGTHSGRGSLIPPPVLTGCQLDASATGSRDRLPSDSHWCALDTYTFSSRDWNLRHVRGPSRNAPTVPASIPRCAMALVRVKWTGIVCPRPPNLQGKQVTRDSRVADIALSLRTTCDTAAQVGPRRR